MFKNLPELVESNMRILGVNVFDALEHFSIVWFLYAVIVFIVLILSVWAVFYKTIIKDKFRGLLTLSYIGLLWVWIPFVYSFSTLSDPPTATGRYLISMNVLFIFSLIILFSITYRKRQLAALIVMIFLLFTMMVTKNTKSLINHGYPNGDNFTVIKTLNNENLSKKYSS